MQINTSLGVDTLRAFTALPGAHRCTKFGGMGGAHTHIKYVRHQSNLLPSQMPPSYAVMLESLLMSVSLCHRWLTFDALVSLSTNS